MPDPQKLSQQPHAQIGTEDDYGMVVQAGETRQQTRPQLRAAILSAWQTFIGAFLGANNTAGARAAIGAIAASDNITGSAAKLTTARTIALTGDGTASLSFDGSANAGSALTLAAVGTAGTYGSVTTDAKGRVTAGNVATPIANGGTGATTAPAALLALAGAPLASPTLTGTPGAPTPSVGTNTTQLATSAMVQNEIANKRAWTSYTPSIVASSGTYTTASATGSSMVAFGICFWQAVITITTKGTGATPRIGLPFPALAGSAGKPILARTINVNFKAGAAMIEAGLTTALLSAADTTDLGSADGAIIHINGCYPVA